MSKENANFNINWYELWAKQSKEFFDSAEKNIKGMFNQATPANPEAHLKQIQAWLDALKKQWQFMPLDEQQKAYENYWKLMSKIFSDASDMMLDHWIKRTRDNEPIKDVHELYELWLNCCHEIYQKSIHTKAYQDAYGEFMNAAIKFWKSATPPK